MKKILTLLLLILVISLTLFSCNDRTKITLSEDAITIEIGQSETLTATASPTDKTYTWSSENEAIATVDDNGTVVGIAKGTTRIFAETEDGKVAECEVTVIYAQSISLDQERLSIQLGRKATIMAEVFPIGTTYTWSSADESIATVENGIVTAVSVGTTTITAETGRGKTAQCKIIVEDTATVSLKDTSLTLVVGSYETIRAEIFPTNTSYTWLSADESVATVSEGAMYEGVIHAVSTGKTTITIETEDGKTASCEIKVIDTTEEEALELAYTEFQKQYTDAENRYFVINSAQNKDNSDTSWHVSFYVLNVQALEEGKVCTIEKICNYSIEKVGGIISETISHADEASNEDAIAIKAIKYYFEEYDPISAIPGESRPCCQQGIRTYLQEDGNWEILFFIECTKSMHDTDTIVEGLTALFTIQKDSGEITPKVIMLP